MCAYSVTAQRSGRSGAGESTSALHGRTSARRRSPRALCGENQRESVEMPNKGFIPNKLRPWIEARKKYRLSHVQIQMARELGLNPKKFGSLSNTKQQPWKLPLPEFIEEMYYKRFKKRAPDNVSSIEQNVRDKERKKVESKARKEMERLSDEPTIT